MGRTALLQDWQYHQLHLPPSLLVLLLQVWLAGVLALAGELPGAAADCSGGTLPAAPRHLNRLSNQTLVAAHA